MSEQNMPIALLEDLYYHLEQKKGKLNRTPS